MARSTTTGPTMRPRGRVATIDENARGLVDPAAALRNLRIGRVAPSTDLAWAVEYHWTVRWDLDGRFEQRVVSHPAVHVTFEPDGAFVTGVATGDWTRELVGTGCVLGVKFRSAGFRPFLGLPAHELTDRVVPLADVFGAAGESLAEAAAPLIAAGRPEDVVPLVEDMLLGTPCAGRDRSETMSALVERLIAEPGGSRVAQVAEELGVTTRRLQRLFADHVGASPKWVLDRARIHEAGERVRLEPDVRWARLAAELGYADQAHLSRRFADAMRITPARYAARQSPRTGGAG